MIIVEYNFSRKINACYDSVMWNYWDHEHLYVVHKNYKDAKIIYEDEKIATYFLDFKLPIFSFLTSKSLNIMYMHDKNTLKVFNKGLLGLFSETTIVINEYEKNKCDLKMSYKFYLDGWKIILKPFLKKMAEKWNNQVWDEDYPIKMRRTKLLKNGFKDFIGMTAEKKKVEKFKLPIKRHIKSPINF
jgi:hypothetical protein